MRCLISKKRIMIEMYLRKKITLSGIRILNSKLKSHKIIDLYDSQLQILMYMT